MAELVPIPLDLQLRRAFLEYAREGKIFDLPQNKFFRGLPGLDLSVLSNGHRAFTPLGPAAGPHDQLLQNIVLCWLGGSRIIELKTIQILDQLKLPRPCIDSANVTYNVEWSQELRLEQSLREYVSASMFLEILKESSLLGEEHCAGFFDTIFDMSAGYNLEGIQSAKVRNWIQGMKNATAIIDELRPTLTGDFRKHRDLAFNPCVSDTITLSTFHGCPAHEIEDIVRFLLVEMGINVCVKMNPTLLGKEQVEHLLHDVLHYQDIKLTDEAFEKDLQFEQALDMIPRLHRVACSAGKQLSLKFSNTLVVRNHKNAFRDELMYMSGPPLHVITLNLVKKFREHMGALVPLSFSAGLTAQNVANMVAMDFVPVTTCTDLLRPGGYGRLHKYLLNLGAKMNEAGAGTISEFTLLHAGQGQGSIEQVVENLKVSLREACGDADSGAVRRLESWLRNSATERLKSSLARPGSLRASCEEIAAEFRVESKSLPVEVLSKLTPHFDRLEQSLVSTAGLLNTPVLVEQATRDPRYAFEQNKSTPRKVGSKLSLFDCLQCEKCVPGCPNDANFILSAPAAEIAYKNYDLLPGAIPVAVEGGVFRVAKSEQIANFADACNECGNCEILCPEIGGPQIAKPRFFGSLETYHTYAGQNGFFLDTAAKHPTIHGSISGKSYILAIDAAADRSLFEDATGHYVIEAGSNRLLSWSAKDTHQEDEDIGPRHLDLLPYLQLKFLLEAVSDSRHVHYVNVAAL